MFYLTVTVDTVLIGGNRVRYQVTGATAINFTVEARKLADLIKLYNIE